MKRSTLWALCAVALLAGIGYVFFARPGVLASVVVIGSPLVLALWASVVGQE